MGFGTAFFDALVFVAARAADRKNDSQKSSKKICLLNISIFFIASLKI